MKGEIHISFKMVSYAKIRNCPLKTRNANKICKATVLLNSHSPELCWAGLHHQTAKSITTTGFPGWKKSPGNVRTLLFLYKSSAACQGRQGLTLWMAQLAQVAEAPPSPLKLPHGGAGRAPWADPCPGQLPRAPRWSCNVLCVHRVSKMLLFPSCCGWGLFLLWSSWGKAEHCSWCDWNTGLWERREPWGGRGEHSQGAPVESAAVTEEREVKKGRGRKKKKQKKKKPWLSLRGRGCCCSKCRQLSKAEPKL